MEVYVNLCKFLDKKQLELQDGFITNKFINKKVIMKAYNSFKKKIYLYKWNYHEDNIWSKLLYNYSNSTLILQKHIYLIIKNNKSLMATIKSNKIEIKNRFYRLETFLELNLTDLKFIVNELKFFKKIYLISSHSKDQELRKKVIHLYFKYINLMNKK